MSTQAIEINNVSYEHKEVPGQHEKGSLFRVLLEDTYGGMARLYEQAVEEGTTWKLGGLL